MPTIAVVAAALFDAQGRVLIAQRPAGKELAGRWEFPGGKIDAGEAPHAALVRELREELGVKVQAAQPLVALEHDYPTRRVQLSLYVVERLRHAVIALDGQTLKWVAVADLDLEDILEADRPFIEALQQRAAAAI